MVTITVRLGSTPTNKKGESSFSMSLETEGLKELQEKLGDDPVAAENDPNVGLEDFITLLTSDALVKEIKKVFDFSQKALRFAVSINDGKMMTKTRTGDDALKGAKELGMIPDPEREALLNELSKDLNKEEKEVSDG